MAGPVSPRFKTGRYSKYLPTRLQERYEEAMTDEELLALRDEVALLDSRLADILETLPEGGGPELWPTLRSVYVSLRDAIQEQDQVNIEAALKKLDRIVQEGVEESQTWAEVYAVIDNRRKVVESERKRLVQMQQMITAEQAIVLISRIQDVIVRNVNDKDALSRIIREFSAITHFQISDGD